MAFGAAFVIDAQVHSLFMENMTSPFLAIGILFYSLGRYTEGRRIWVGVLVVYVPTTLGLALTE